MADPWMMLAVMPCYAMNLYHCKNTGVVGRYTFITKQELFLVSLRILQHFLHFDFAVSDY